MPDVTSLYDMETGKAINLHDWPPAPLDTNRYHWNWDLAGILETHAKSAEMWHSLGATVVDGDQPLNKVVDTVLRHVK